ncbi:MAG: 4-hydroxybenzoate octaprenyltransferase [Gammaproteobacteria bacterium]|nr:4-hydroxybenzoate octaprenyltransferase [Gammaproteobacteria bacterium]
MKRIGWQQLAVYARLVRLHRPIGIYLVLWPTLWALWLASGGVPDSLILTVFIAGVVLMRSAGCAINDYADRHIDGHVSRTRDRPLAAGEATPAEAIALFLLLSFIAFLLVLQLNRLTILLSVPALLLAASYPFSKRYTHLPQAYLGIAFASAIPMAFAAVLNEVPAASWLVFLVAVLWAIAYDTMYAMADRQEDLKIGVKSSAILFAAYDRLAIGICQLLLLALLWWIGQIYGLGWIYQLGLALAALFFIYQQWLIRQREATACFNAFLNNHYFGMVVFLAMAVDYGW